MKKKMISQIPQLFDYWLVIVLFHVLSWIDIMIIQGINNTCAICWRHLKNPRDDTNSRFISPLVVIVGRKRKYTIAEKGECDTQSILAWTDRN